MSLDSLIGGFSHLSGEEEPRSKEEHQSEEELVSYKSDIKEKTHTNGKNSKRILRGGVNIKTRHVKPKCVKPLKKISTNGAGVKNGKAMSLRSEVRNTQANIVTIQETHSTQKGKILMDSEFVVFESIRKKKGGGTLVLT